MKKTIIGAGILSMMLIGCGRTNHQMAYADFNSLYSEEMTGTHQQEDEGYVLMKTNCYTCHNPGVKSHDDILAPPFKAVKMHYTQLYDNKSDFVNAVVNWVQGPDENKALMFGAVRRFNLMPKMDLGKEDLGKIASYLYDNNVDEPKWFQGHINEKHKDGMGKGKADKMRNNESKKCNCNKGSCGSDH